MLTRRYYAATGAADIFSRRYLLDYAAYAMPLMPLLRCFARIAESRRYFA